MICIQLWPELLSHMCCTTPRKSNSFGCTTLTVKGVLWIFPRIALIHQLFQFRRTSTRQTKISQPKCYVAWRRKVIMDESARETRCTNISVAVGCFFFFLSSKWRTCGMRRLASKDTGQQRLSALALKPLSIRKSALGNLLTTDEKHNQIDIHTKWSVYEGNLDHLRVPWLRPSNTVSAFCTSNTDRFFLTCSHLFFFFALRSKM